jgi:hypothetical protein
MTYFGSRPAAGLSAAGEGSLHRGKRLWRILSLVYSVTFQTHKAKTPRRFPGRGFAFVRSLTMTYFHMRNAHYHRRKVVSLSCSGWEGVGPTRYGRQT